ncbi:MAG: SPOR domain-containing protein [Candidatus Omnitrophota bacterium]
MNSVDDKVRPLQLDLFAIPEIAQPRRSGLYNRLTSRVNLTLETAVILFIFLVLSFLLVFSFGVERGKRLASLKLLSSPNEKKTSAETDYQRVAVSQVKPVPPSGETAVKMATPLKVVSLGSRPAGRYTIQVASFTKAASAKKEAEGLRKLGYAISLRSSGAFHYLCVGNYTDKQEAEIVLKKLRSKYRDCFIRRL